MFKIINREEVGGGAIIMNEIEAPKIARKVRPGQFVILQASETGERIPLTVADLDAEKGTITIYYMVIGTSTAQFRDMNVGDSFTAVIGPLGKPTDIENVGRVVCIGGGTGIAVLHPITRALKRIGNHVTTILGSRTQELLIMESQMNAVSDQFRICTDDGSYGHKGFVTDLLKDEIENGDPIGLVVAIGPVPMMKAVSEMTRTPGIHTLVSLNPIMIDGTGMCGCCRVTVGGDTRFACVDGPEFDGHQVDFQGLMQRLDAYKEEETRRYDAYLTETGNCRIR